MEGVGRLASALNKTSEEVAYREEVERLALDEVARGFPLLMSHNTVGLWSALEAALTRFPVDWLCFRPELLKKDILSKTKVPAILLSTANFAEAAAFVVDEFTRQSGGASKQGIGRFTFVLQALGINVKVDDGIRKTLFQLSKVRNLYAHRFGIVDVQFRESCPWLNATLGSRLQTGAEDMERYELAARDFAALVVLAAAETLTPQEQAALRSLRQAAGRARGSHSPTL
jgi:hypothetical protein